MNEEEPIPAQITWLLNTSWQHFPYDLSAIGYLEKNILADHLTRSRWFGGKARKIFYVEIDSLLSLNSPNESGSNDFFFILILKVNYSSGIPEHYLLPLSLISKIKTVQIPVKGIIAALSDGSGRVLIDAIYDDDFRALLFKNIFHSSRLLQENGSLVFEKGKAFREADISSKIVSTVLDADQSNSAFIFQKKYFFKMYRKLFPEINPDVEMVSFLTEKTTFKHIPSYAGSVSWKKEEMEITLGMMQEKVVSVKDCWSLVSDFLDEYLHAAVNKKIFSVGEELLRHVKLLAQRTAEMHLALASGTDDAFSPEPFTEEYRSQQIKNFASLLNNRITLAGENLTSLDAEGMVLAGKFLNDSVFITKLFSELEARVLLSRRIRIHGDYHLGQVLFTGTDFIILDFEGEPENTVSSRKIKHSPLKDVAGMLRSFHYAVSAKFYFSDESKKLNDEEIEKASRHWYQTIAQTYLHHYFAAMGMNSIVGNDAGEHLFLLHLHLLEKAVYELGYEFNSRPAWVKIPLRGIMEVMNEMVAFR